MKKHFLWFRRRLKLYLNRPAFASFIYYFPENILSMTLPKNYHCFNLPCHTNFGF